MSKKQPLKIHVTAGNELVIRIGVDTLKTAAENSEHFNTFDEKKNDWRRAFKITNPVTFALGVKNFLEDEDEIGHTAITRALDNGILHAIEGDYGVDEVDEV